MQGINLSNLASHFSDEDSAQDLLEQIRWPNGPACPHCGSTKVYKLEPKEASKKSRKALRLWKCGGCRQQFTITVGTIFEDSHLPLHQWLLAIHLLCSSKKGMSARQLHRMLGITYKSAWFMAHRIRYAMSQPPLVDKLSGIVEAGETCIGGKAHGKRGRGAENNTPVFTLIERGGLAKSTKVKQVTGKNLKEVIRQHVVKDSTMMTDSFPAYSGLGSEFADHQTVDHEAGEYVRGIAHVNSAESYFATLERGINVVYHHVSEQNLDHYLAEFDFRYNARKIKDGERTVEAIESTTGKRLTYHGPVSDQK